MNSDFMSWKSNKFLSLMVGLIYYFLLMASFFCNNSVTFHSFFESYKSTTKDILF
jgi:hypothetical protein